MGWPKRLVMVRHAESVGNIRSADERALSGEAAYSYGLTERGRKQAEITGKYLRETYGEFDVYYVSYYKRALETLRILYPEAKIYEDPRLAEGQRGIWQTMTKAEIALKYPEEVARKQREGHYHYRPPGGENWPDIELRIHSFLGTLSRDCEGLNVLIVVHGHWMVLFQRLVHRFSIDEALRRYSEAVVENASVTIYRGETIDNRSRLVLEAENIVPWSGLL